MAKAKTTKPADKAVDIKQMTNDQIEKRLVEIAKEKMNLRFQKASGQEVAVKMAMPLRKETARLKTEQSARRLSKGV